MGISRRNLIAGGSAVALGGLVAARGWRLRPPSSTVPDGGIALAPGGSVCVSRATASASAGTVQNVAAQRTLRIDTLARFVDPLPIPATLQPLGRRPDRARPGVTVPFYRVAMGTVQVRLHRDLPPTRMWGYGGSVPGPTLETRSGQAFLVEWANELPGDHMFAIDHTLHGASADLPAVRATVHMHGAKAPPESDGHPESWFPPGKSAVLRYPNEQDATTLWYHDHAMGIERLNQYAGLFGAHLLRDDTEDALGLPRGDAEVPLVLCDRILDPDAQLVYPTSGDPAAPWVSEVFGDAHLVNGKLFPYHEVSPGPCRLRVVNASNARFYQLSLSNGAPLHQIGSDQGLLAAPVDLMQVTLAPGERADLVVDFSADAGQTVVLKGQSFELLQFRVRPGPRQPHRALPRVLRAVPRLPAAAASKTRTMSLDQYQTGARRMTMLLNGAYWHDPVTEKPELGATEIWELVNKTEDPHPIHLHLVRFQVLDRQLIDVDHITGVVTRLGAPIAPEPGEMGWKDTVRADPDMVTRIVVRFDGFVGRYVWHCHVLEHAANEMMRPFEVVAPA
jgi:spore coat protein A